MKHVRSFLTFDLWPLNHRSDKEITMNTFWWLTLTNTLAWSVLFLKGFLNFELLHVFKQIWAFLTFDPLTTGRMKRSPWTLFDNWHWPTHWHGQFCWGSRFKIWSFKVTPNNPKMTFNKKFLNTLKEPLAKDLVTQVSSKSIELCRWRSVLSVFELWSQMTPRWPLTPNSWTPLMSLYPMIVVSKYHKNPSRHTWEKAFWNRGWIDR